MDTIATNLPLPHITNPPYEISAQCLGELDLRNLTSASHTCRQWRAAARSCPTFWQNIQLRILSSSAIECFTVRLGSNNAVGVSLFIALSSAPSAWNKRRLLDVFATIQQNLHRVRSLIILLSYDEMEYARPVLTSPAPVLEHVDCRTGNSQPTTGC
jgi:hypothetical protein